MYSRNNLTKHEEEICQLLLISILYLGNDSVELSPCIDRWPRNRRLPRQTHRLSLFLAPPWDPCSYNGIKN
jgi:hypothetical protein